MPSKEKETLDDTTRSVGFSFHHSPGWRPELNPALWYLAIQPIPDHVRTIYVRIHCKRVRDEAGIRYADATTMKMYTNNELREGAHPWS